MITVQTSNSRVVNNDGSLATGFLIITSVESFQFTDTDSKRKKVTMEPMQFTFVSGVLSSPSTFQIAPTVNASQNKTNLYYTVLFVTNAGKWTEYWTIDANSSDTLELTDVTKVIPSPIATTTDFISADSVSTTPGADLIPRAKSDGTIDLGWFLGIPGGVAVYSYTGNPLPTLTSGVLAVGLDTGEDQIKVWDGSKWRTVA